MTIVHYEIIHKVGVIRLNNPPVNALSQALRAGIQEALELARTDNSEAILLVCEGTTFIAGADISEFGKPPLAPSLPDLLALFDAYNKPIIAAIHGTALGGGFELALACHYRCAANSAKVGLPEVKLGLLPGAGGTQRVPRLAGAEAALELITQGNPISASKALAMNLIDKVFDEQTLVTESLAFAQELITAQAPLKRVSDRCVTAPSNSHFFEESRANLARKMRGQIAPLKIVDCIEAACSMPIVEGLAFERECFIACMESSQSAAMRHLFFAERQAAKISGIDKNTPLRPIASVAIIGGGTMGGGIAMNFANVGIAVQMLEVSDQALERGLSIIEKNYDMSLSKGKITQAQKQAALKRIYGTTSYQDIGNADLVIEAVFEDIEIKKQVFKKLDESCKQGAILASNTSYQNLDEIAAATQRPQDVIGLHFFSPANVMKLLEIVRGRATSDEVIASAMKIAKVIKKVPVLSGVCYGFIGNRMLRQYGQQAQLCLIECGSPEPIDQALESWGMAMGPLAVSDLAGLDISYKARQALTDEQKGDPKTYCVADALVELGRLGQKSGSGYYQYDPKTRKRSFDPAVSDVINACAEKHQVTNNTLADTEIVERLIYALINEGAKILEEGIAQRASDIDVVYVFGYGFPIHRGGPMHYADTVGIKKVYEKIQHFQSTLDATFWEPAALLKELAESGQSFSQWSKQ